MRFAIDNKLIYKYGNKLYMPSGRKFLRINDMFIDLRDCQYKIVESNDDIIDMSFIDPELYIVLEEVEEEN